MGRNQTKQSTKGRFKEALTGIDAGIKQIYESNKYTLISKLM